MAGSVSGGCVENDVFERALQVLDDGQPVVSSYGIADDLGIRVGLSCGGTIDVLIEPFTPDEAWRSLRQAVDGQRPAAWIVGLAPSSLLGRKLVVLGDADAIGSIDPALDQELVARARRLLPEGGTRCIGLPWRGEEASVFIEAFPPPLRLFILGATHTAIALSRMAKQLGFRVIVIDARSPFATSERFPEADEVLREWPHEVLAEQGLDPYSYVVSLSHDFKFEIPALERALRSTARYVGALGSRVTHEKRKGQLRERGFAEADLARIRAPIGLDLGARTPEEIALSILAELLAVRHERDGAALTHRRAPIHGSR
jgi:xanthine dehydrogenase accessory factor